MAHTIEMDQVAEMESEQIEIARIDDPRDHSQETQERLRQLLANGAPARPDPKRSDVFEIEDQERIFYIHVAKSSGNVTLLAVWNRDAQYEDVSEAAILG